jgi:hypothetical protein
MYRMYGSCKPLLRLQDFCDPWRSPEMCSCYFRIPAIPSGHAAGAWMRMNGLAVDDSGCCGGENGRAAVGSAENSLYLE